MTVYFKLFFAFSLLIVMSACGDDNDVSPDSLEGTWRAVSFTASAETTSEFDGDVTTAITNIVGTNMDYEVIFTESDYDAKGTYDMEIRTTVNGDAIPANDQSYSDVEGGGTYTTEGDQITLNGSLFDVEFSAGGTTQLEAEEQVAKYEINGDGQLIFTENTTTETEQSDILITSEVTAKSVWERQ